MRKPVVLHIISVFIILSFSKYTVAQEQKDSQYFFYSREDIRNIKKSSATVWGKSIVEGFRKIIDERKKYPLYAPDKEGGYIHDYFCPIHGQQFVFDWNKPADHFCEACGKDWSGENKYDMAWIAMAHSKNLDYLYANMFLFLISDSVEYADNAKQLLLSYAEKYPSYVEHNRTIKQTTNYSGKMFSQSLDEAVWANKAARVYSVIKGRLTDKENSLIKQNYLKECTNLLLTKKVEGNWQTWHNCALAALGIALENESIVDIALNDPDFGYYTNIRQNVYPDGWWKEGSVVYHFYPLEAIVSTAEAVRCRNINLYNNQLRNMFSAPLQMSYSDLTLPSQNDGWYGTSLIGQAGLYEIAAIRFDEPGFKNLLSLCYLNSKRKSPNALINGMEVDKTPSLLERESVLFPDLGVAMLKYKDKTVALKYGPDGGVHGHPDKLSISIHNGEDEILPDLGTPAYGVPTYREWYKNTFSHNTVTVDKINQEKACGELLDFSPNHFGGSASALVKVNKNVMMKRKLRLHKNLFYDTFSCHSDSIHTYDYVLILTGSACFSEVRDTLLPEYKWMKNVRYKNGKGTFTIMEEYGCVKLKLKSPDKFTVFTATAPGVPPKQEEKTVAQSYPLILRCQSEKMKVKAKLRFKN